MSYRRILYICWVFLIIFVLAGCKKTIPDRFEAFRPAYIPADMRLLIEDNFKPGLNFSQIQRLRLVSAQSETTSFYLEYYEAVPGKNSPLSGTGLDVDDSAWKKYASGAKTLCRERAFDGVDFEECYIYFNEGNFFLFGSIVEHQKLSLKPETLLPALFLSK